MVLNERGGRRSLLSDVFAKSNGCWGIDSKMFAQRAGGENGKGRGEGRAGRAGSNDDEAPNKIEVTGEGIWAGGGGVGLGWVRSDFGANPGGRLFVGLGLGLELGLELGLGLGLGTFVYAGAQQTPVPGW
jgi:hypothetical protein